MTPDNRQWFAVHTRPHGESCAARNVERQGFEVYFPRYLKKRRHARRTEIVAAPFFPRYLFVAVDMATQRWRAINSSFGVSRLVGWADQPLSVSPSIISALRQRESEDGFIALQSEIERLKPGAPVYITSGPFADCRGLFEAVTDNERVQILLDLLGRKVRVAIDQESIAVA